MASPSDLWLAFWKFHYLFLDYGWDTPWRTAVGLMLAVLVGVALGMVMGFSEPMRDALYPLLVGFNAIPKAIMVPIIALIFVGQHYLESVLIAFMISFSQLLYQSQSDCRPWNRNIEIFCLPLRLRK